MNNSVTIEFKDFGVRLDFTPFIQDDGTIRLETRYDKEREVAVIRVEDDGHGIEPQNLSRIFDPFFTTKEVGKGTGMGLAVIHGIVKDHNGGITVKSELGKGTTFSIFFPAVEKEAEVEIESDEELPTGDERILFVDDEPALANIGQQTLESLGYKVTARTSSIEALATFREQPLKYDLVITDMTMPNMNGDRLAREMKKIRRDIIRDF